MSKPSSLLRASRGRAPLSAVESVRGTWSSLAAAGNFERTFEMKKYGLQLRVPASQQKKGTTRPPLPPPAGFRDEDDDDVEREISRHASKNKSLRDVEEQHKKALEEDPSVFDYDGVYDEMKGQIARPRAQDREERKPRYIHTIMKKAEERQREQEIIYDRKLAKERTKEDHLFADKDKFVTSAYKKKLAEQAKWIEEDRIRQLKEEKDDVTKKTDLSDFYFNLEKNVAYGASQPKKQEKQPEASKPEMQGDQNLLPAAPEPGAESSSKKEAQLGKSPHQQGGTSSEQGNAELSNPQSAANESTSDKPPAVGPAVEQPTPDHHKRNVDAVAAAKERFLARKRAKEQ